jgi:hypothetical protein
MRGAVYKILCMEPLHLVVYHAYYDLALFFLNNFLNGLKIIMIIIKTIIGKIYSIDHVKVVCLSNSIPDMPLSMVREGRPHRGFLSGVWFERGDCRPYHCEGRNQKGACGPTP